VHGNYIRLNNVRAINWGCQAGSECFVLTVGGTANNVIEDSIVEKRSENNTHESTLLGSIGSNPDTASGRACAVRNNYTNSEYSNGFLGLVRVTSIQRISPTIALLTTAEPHRHLKSKNLVVKGALVSGNLNNAYNGTFAITEIVSDTQLKYFMYADPGMDADVSGGVTIGHGVSSEIITIGWVDEYQASDEFVWITTKRPHNRTPGQIVAIVGIGELPFGASTAFDAHTVTYHQIVEVGPANDFRPSKFKIRKPAGVPPWIQLYYPSAILVGTDTHGPAAGMGTGCVTEGNRVYDAEIACYTDTGSTRDMIVRNNLWNNVYFGFHHNMGNRGGVRAGSQGTVTTAIPASSLTFDPAIPTRAIFNSGITPHGFVTDDFVLITGASSPGYNGVFQIIKIDDYTFRYDMPTAQTQNATGAQAVKQLAACVTNNGLLATFAVPVEEPHGLLPGNAVDIALAIIPGLSNPFANPFNGTFTVKSVPSPTTFTYDLASLPTGVAFGLPTYAFRWQTRRLLIERNRIELRSADHNSYSSPVGASLAWYAFSGQAAYLFPRVLMRENLIGYSNNGGDTRMPPGTAGLAVTTADAGILAHNVLDVKTEYPKQCMEFASRNVSYFDNRDSAGNLIRGYNQSTGIFQPQLEDEVESALLFSF